MLQYTPMSNAWRLRELIDYLGLPEGAAAHLLGVSRGELRQIVGSVSTPSLDVRQRVEMLSREWPRGLICVREWPCSVPDPEVREKPPVSAPVSKKRRK